MVDTALLAFDIDGLENQRLAHPVDALVWMKALDATLARVATRNGRKSACFAANVPGDADHAPPDALIFFPISHDARHARIDHVLVHAPKGFDAAAIDALKRLKQVKNGKHTPVIVVLVDIGPKSQFAGTVEHFGSSFVWQSKTPFVVDSSASLTTIESIVREELSEKGHSPCVSIEVEVSPGRYQSIAALREGSNSTASIATCIDFPRRGSSKSSDFDGLMCRLRLRFDTLVHGPMALGRWARYGMGQFLPG